MRKAEARAYFLAKRMMLSERERAEKSLLIVSRMQEVIDIPKRSFVLSYLPMMQKGELDIFPINTFLEEKYEARICFPRMLPNDCFEAVHMHKGGATKKHTQYLFNEPQQGAVIEPCKLSLVITPLIIFDTSGIRVGYGKGMYDNFFTGISDSCIKLGCSFFSPIEKVIDAHSFDKKLDVGVTPTKTYFFATKMRNDNTLS